MFVLRVLLLAGIAGGCVVGALTAPFWAPGCHTRDDLKRRATHRRLARKTIAHFEAKNAGKPLYQWPDRDRQGWQRAKELLADLGESDE